MATKSNTEIANPIASQKYITEFLQRLPFNREIFLAIAYFLVVAFLSMAVPFTGIIVPAVVLVVMVLAWTAADFRVGAVLTLVLLQISGTVFVPRELLGIQGLNPINALILATILSYVISHTGAKKLSIPWTPSLLYFYFLPFMLASLVGITKVHLIPGAFETMRLTSFTSGIGYFRDLFIKPNFVILGAMLMALVIQEARQPSRYLHVISVGCVLLSGAVIGAFIYSGASISLLSSSGSRGFLSILGMHANEIGLALNLGYSILIFSMIGQKGYSRMLIVMTLIAMAIGILITFSRGAIAAFLIVNIIFLIRRRQISTLIAFGIIAIAVGLIFYEPILARLGTGVETGDRAQLSAGRLDRIWLPLLDDISFSWLLPHGPSAIMWSKPMLNGSILFVGHTHSAYLGLLYDYGFILGALIAGFLIHLFRQFIRFSKEDSDLELRHLFEGAAVAMLVLAMQGISDDRFTPTVAQAPFWCAVGILIGRGGLKSVPKAKAAPKNRSTFQTVHPA